MERCWLWLIGLLFVVLVGSAGCIPPKDEGPSLALWLEAKSEVRVGETADLKLKVRNSSDRLVELTLGGRPAYDFVVTKPDGMEVWSWLHGQVIQDILELKTLNPGEELEFAAEWEQVDNEGNPVPPGTYLVRGVLNTEPPQKLETEPKQLIISP